MKITDISTTILFDPNARALQDATIPKVWKGGGTHIYLHIKTDAGIEGLGYSQAMPAYAVREIIERELSSSNRRRSVQYSKVVERYVLADAKLWSKRSSVSCYLDGRCRFVGFEGKST